MERAICLGDIERIRELDSPNRRFAATSFGVKTRMAPLSAAVGRVQLRHLDERNSQRTANVEYLSERLERLGVHTFRSPAHIRRVYFEYFVRLPASPMPRDLLVRALQAEGCEASLPRYPLLHQQPIFTEGLFARIARLEGNLPRYSEDDLPKTTRANMELLRLPSFPNTNRALLDEYAFAFEKVLANADAIMAGEPSERQ
jgi:dTDP-4-amino-4,6-dideoxygalactose transaminase